MMFINSSGIPIPEISFDFVFKIIYLKYEF